MAIATGIPTNQRRPGFYPRFEYSTAPGGSVPIDYRVLLVGTKSAAGTATAEQPVEVLDALDGDTKAGRGSELAMMVRAFYRQAALQGNQPRLFIVPLAPPGGGAANVQTLTVTGPATSDGNLEFRIAGRPFSVGVANADTATAIAANIVLAVNARAAELPVTATSALGVVTLTNATLGANGAATTIAIDRTVAGTTAVVATTAAGAGTVDITLALDAARGADYHGIAIANFAAADIADAKAHTTESWGYALKRYRHVVMGHRGTLATAQALASAANDPTILVATYEDAPNLPGEIAAAVAAAIWGEERPNANYDYKKLALYPPATASVYSSAEIESALAGGMIPIRPTAEADNSEIVRVVTTKVTTSGAPDYATFDLATTRTAAWFATQVDIRWQQEFTGPDALVMVDEDAPEDVRKRVKDMIVGIYQQGQTAGYLRDMEEFKAQIQVEESLTVAGRLDAIIPFRVVSPLHQLAALIHAYL